MHARLREFAEARGIEPKLAGDLVRELVGCQHELVEQFRQKAEQEPQLPFGAEECVSVSTEAAQSATDAALCELVSARSR